jgi:hypothetical protein
LEAEARTKLLETEAKTKLLEAQAMLMVEKTKAISDPRTMKWLENRQKMIRMRHA